MPEPPKPTGADGSVPPKGDAKGDLQGGEATFESWISKQPDDVKALIEGHVGGLKSAHERQKEETKSLKSEIDQIKRSKDLDADQKVKAIEEKLNEAERKAAFHESLPSDCTNRRLAYLAAQDIDAIRKDGTVDVERLRKECPELFGGQRGKVPSGKPGAGTGTPPPSTMDVNAAIRGAAGFGS